MTYTPTKPNHRTGGKLSKKTAGKRGFALIASLTLMMLLGLIAVGVLAVASSQNRAAAHAALQAEARQQALMGLDAALAEMQMALGPDQRVTASSGIISENSNTPQHILGVWDSWTQAIYDKRNGNIQSTYTPGRRSQFRRWLISSRNPQELSQFESVSHLGTREPGRRVCLVGQGTLGHSADAKDYIYADMVEMPASGKNIGSYAWWVSGDNQKANATIKDREKSLDLVETLRHTWDTPAPDFQGSTKLDMINLSDEEKAKMLTLRTLLVPTKDGGHLGYVFHDVTTYSYSLPINVRDGGFKYDLNRLLDQDSLKETPFAPRSNQDCPLAEDDAIPSCSENNMPIGSWQRLHAYYNMWPNGSSGSKGESTGAEGTAGFSRRLQGNVKNAHTLMSGHLEHTTMKGDSVTIVSDRIMESDSTSGYARTPVLLSFVGAHGLTIGEPGVGQGGFSYGLSYAPFVLWWNPYNVKMHVKAKKLWAYSLPYRTTSVLIWIGSQWKRWPMLQPQRSTVIDNNSSAPGQRNTFANDWGNYFVNSVQDQKSDIIFEPGEILFFSMSESFNNLRMQNNANDGRHETVCFSQPQKIPFILGDNAGEAHNYFISMYSYGTNHMGEKLALSLETSSLYREAVANRWITSRIDNTDGQESDNSYLYDVIGDVISSGARELFTVVHGVAGIDASEKANQGLTESRISSKPNRFIGAGGILPGIFTMGWYDYDEVPKEGLTFCGIRGNYTWSRNMELYAPTYFTALGVAPKSFNPSLNEALPMFAGKDYRTKVWQHSNPALGSAALYKPDDQERQYNPFQLIGIEVGTGLGRGSLDSVNNRNGIYGITGVGSGGGEGVSFISVLELPQHPIFSIAGFAGMRLTPGWYEDSGDKDSLAAMRRMQYQAGVPGVGIGNSFADPCIEPDAIYTFHKSNLTDLFTRSHKNAHLKIFSEFYDHAVLINDALWDRWFCSSVSRMPDKSGRTIEARATLEKFMKGENSLPVSRYKRNIVTKDAEKIINRLMQKDGWMHIARYLWIEGGFNVNSVSEEAWAAVLRGLAKRDLLSNAGGELRRVNKDAQEDVLFSRFAVSTSMTPINNISYDPLQGSSSVRPSLKMATAWGEVRELDPEGIRELARQIVKQVRARGPFLNMSDFINRRLDGGSDNALTGALQAAIDATNINQAFNESSYNVTPQQKGSLYKYQNAAKGSMYTAAPGYLIQSDVLSSLGNILTVRDDTFTVRAYGCVRNSRNAVLAQAWCEATVQRTVDYVDPTNSPEDTDRTDATARSNRNPGKRLTELNRLMGRKLKVISFRWLDSWDI